jgi:hypothetical protein
VGAVVVAGVDNFVGGISIGMAGGSDKVVSDNAAGGGCADAYFGPRVDIGEATDAGAAVIDMDAGGRLDACCLTRGTSCEKCSK